MLGNCSSQEEFSILFAVLGEKQLLDRHPIPLRKLREGNVLRKAHAALELG